ncbi:unnamed protein product [Schistosoma turkestanicum]|nr:unnamed protein product [Schistosoma turkestanicum]
MSENEQDQIHLTNNSLSTNHYDELMKTDEIFIHPTTDNNNNMKKKCLHSIKRVHKLIEEELLMEYDMKPNNKTTTQTPPSTSTTTTTTATPTLTTIVDYDNEMSRRNKLSRYHEQNEFSTPCHMISNKKDPNRPFMLTPKHCTKTTSTPTSLLYDLLTGTENFDSVYMRSQLVFVTCEQTKSMNRRKINHSRRRKSLKPRKRLNSIQYMETSMSSNDRKVFEENHLDEKLSSSSPLSASSSSSSSSSSPSSSSPSSSLSSSSSSSMLSPSQLNLLTCSQVSPHKLFDGIEYLKNNHMLHSQSQINHCSTACSDTVTSVTTSCTTSTMVNNHECSEQPLDLSSASCHSNQSAICNNNFKFNNIPQSNIIIPKRRRSFAGDFDYYTPRLSNNPNIIRHNSVTLPISPKVNKFRWNCMNSNPNTTTTSNNSSIKLEHNTSELKNTEQKSNVNNLANTLLLNNSDSILQGSNLLSLILSPVCYQIALSTAFALCASSIFQSFSNIINRSNHFSNSSFINNNNNNNLKTTNELVQNQHFSSKFNQSPASSSTSSSSESSVETPKTVHKQHSPAVSSKFNVKKFNSLLKLKTGENVPLKKSTTNLCFFPKTTQLSLNDQTKKHLKQKINKSSCTTPHAIYQHSNKKKHKINNNVVTQLADSEDDEDKTDDNVINAQHSFIASSFKNSSQESMFFFNQLKQWFIQMINLIERPKLAMISFVHKRYHNITKVKSRKSLEKLSNLSTLFKTNLLDQSFDNRLKLLNKSWYRLLIVYLIEYKQLNCLLTINSSLSPSPPSSSPLPPTDDSKLNEEKFKSIELMNLFHDDIQSIASICYALKFTHSMYNLLRIGLLILGNDQEAQSIGNIDLLEQALLEYLVTSTDINKKSDSNLNLSSQSCQTLNINHSHSSTTTTTTTTSVHSDVLNCSNMSNSSSSSSSSNSSSNDNISIDTLSSMIHILIEKLLNLTKDSIIFSVSNQLGDSVEELFHSLIKISRT